MKKGVAQAWKCKFLSFSPTCFWPFLIGLVAWVTEAWKNLLSHCNTIMQQQSKMTLWFELRSVQFSIYCRINRISKTQTQNAFYAHDFLWFFIFKLVFLWFGFSLLIANCPFASVRRQSTVDSRPGAGPLNVDTVHSFCPVLHSGSRVADGGWKMEDGGRSAYYYYCLTDCSCIQISLIKCLMAMRRDFNCTLAWLWAIFDLMQHFNYGRRWSAV